MKNKLLSHLGRGGSIFLILLLGLPGVPFAAQAAAPAQAVRSSTAPIDESDPAAAMLAAEERFRQAEKEFQASDAQARGAAGSRNATSTATVRDNNSYTGPASSTSIAPRAQEPAKSSTPAAPSTPARQEPARQDVQMGTGPTYAGSPQTGYSAIWNEPNGDVMTSVIAPSEPVQTTPVYPMVIEPLVNGYDAYGQNNAWSSGGNWNNWHQPPSGQMQAPWGPSNPNYRPLRPNNPSIWQPDAGSWAPPQAGWQPGPPMQPDGMPGMPPQPGLLPPSQGQPGAFPPNPGNPGNLPPASNLPGTPPMPGQPDFQPPIPGNTLPPVPGQPGINQPPNFGQPGMQPPVSWQPGSGWQGAAPGPRPGFMPLPNRPGIPATMRPLPMNPAGHPWGNPGGLSGGPRERF